jgi:hypothetical protein
MLPRANTHIKKYNQLVEVYGPAGLEPLELVSSGSEANLEQRKAETAKLRERVQQLTAEDFFDEQRMAEIADTDSLPEPAAVADSQREDMLDRLSNIEDALSESLTEGTGLDTADDLEF